MQLTIIPDRVDRAFAAKVVEGTLGQASYPADDPRHEPVLRRLVELWVRAGCRFDTWGKQNPREREILSREANRWTLTFAATRKGRPAPVLSNHPFVPEGQQRREQMDLQEHTGYQAFVTFLVCAAPRFDVGKCGRCGNFFWNRWGHLNKRFCGRKCSQLQTAKEGQAKELAKERREKNARIRKAIGLFVNGKPGVPDWKAWVAGRADVSIRYITRALNRGLQGKPDSLKLTRQQVQYLKSKTKGA